MKYLFCSCFVLNAGFHSQFLKEWLIPTPLDNRPQIEKELFPRPPKREDGSYIYDRVPEYPPAPKVPRSGKMNMEFCFIAHFGP